MVNITDIYVVLWVVAIVLCTTAMFSAYKDDELSKFQTVTYLMFSGPAWSIGLSIIIYICKTGYGGVVDSYLSWSVWEPLAKMTYGAYTCTVRNVSSVSPHHHINHVQYNLVHSDLY